MISPVWTTIAEKQHSLEKLHNFLLHKNGRYREESPSPSPPSPATTGSMIETAPTDANRNSQRVSPMSPSANTYSTATNNYLTTAMLLGSQNCNYLGQAVKSEPQRQHTHSGDNQSPSPSPPPLQPHPSAMRSSADQPVQIIGRMATGNGSPFLLKHQSHQHMDTDSQRGSSNGGQSPVSATALSGTPNSLFTIDSILAPKSTSNPSSPQSPSSTHSPTPIRPTRVPGLLHHPGLHLGHLAAAAASGFGATSDFLGEWRQRRLICRGKSFSCNPVPQSAFQCVSGW